MGRPVGWPAGLRPSTGGGPSFFPFTVLLCFSFYLVSVLFYFSKAKIVS